MAASEPEVLDSTTIIGDGMTLGPTIVGSEGPIVSGTGPNPGEWACGTSVVSGPSHTN